MAFNDGEWNGSDRPKYKFNSIYRKIVSDVMGTWCGEVYKRFYFAHGYMRSAPQPYVDVFENEDKL